MKESFFRRLMNSLLDRQERANTMARIAAVVAGLTACALALAPMLETGASMQSSRFVAPGARSATGPAPAANAPAAYADFNIDPRSP